MRFGPFTPQEIDEIAEQLKSINANFELWYDEDSSQAELKAQRPSESTLGHTFRDRHFYLDVEDVELARDSRMRTLVEEFTARVNGTV